MWNTLSNITAVMPTRRILDNFNVNSLTTFLLLMVFQTIGKSITALAMDDIIATLPATVAVILPCSAIVAAAAVVLAELINPPKKPVTIIPILPKTLVSSVPDAWIMINNRPNHKTLRKEIGDVNLRSIS